MFDKKRTPPAKPTPQAPERTPIPSPPAKKRLTEEQAKAFAQAIRSYLHEDEGQ